jgi:hypothetical protein
MRKINEGVYLVIKYGSLEEKSYVEMWRKIGKVPQGLNGKIIYLGNTVGAEIEMKGKIISLGARVGAEIEMDSRDINLLHSFLPPQITLPKILHFVAINRHKGYWETKKPIWKGPPIQAQRKGIISKRERVRMENDWKWKFTWKYTTDPELSLKIHLAIV